MPEILFRCKHCKTLWNSYEEAVSCEETHLKVKSVSSPIYYRSAYPASIECIFDDDTQKTYLLCEDMFYGDYKGANLKNDE